MSQLTLEQALTSICSHVQKARADGLRDLKHLLIRNKNSKELQSLGEEAYHDIFEALFRSLSLEKDNYARAKTSSTKRTALTRLEFCASAIRTSVEVLGRRISPKSLFAVCDHITAALHDFASEVGKCLSSPFLKALRTLLEYPPHIERLTRKRWQKLCDFCLQSLRMLGSGADTQDSPFNTPLANSVHSGSVQASAISRKRSFEENYGAREELELIFHLLCSSSIAPLADEGAKILIPLLEYLLPIQNLSSSSSSILGAFNIILSKSLVTDITLSQRALIEILPLIRPRSLPRSTALRKEMMITLELARSVLPYVKDVELTRLLNDKLPNLVDHLHHEYRKLSDKGFLRLDDITFTSPHATGPMGIPGMAPRLGIARAEEAWTWVRAIASFATLLDQKDMISEFRQEDDSSDVGRPLKRRFKIIQFDNYLDSSHTADGCEKILALQLLPFLLRGRETSREEIRSLLTGLNANIQGDHDEIRSWTMVAISSIAAIKDASSELLKPLWLQTWSLASRAVSSPHTSRAACFLIASIIHHDLLDESTIFKTVNTMLSFVEMNGPSRLTDASAFMWSCLLRKSSVSQPLRNQYISTQICTWVRKAWVYDTMADKNYSVYSMTLARPREIIELLLACTNRHIRPPSIQFHGPLTRISKAWFCSQLDSDLMKYLIGAEESDARIHPGTSIDSAKYEELAKHQSNDDIVLELLHTKMKQLSQFWESLLTEEARLITSDTIRMLTPSCVIASFFLSLTEPSSENCYSELKLITRSLWLSLCSFFEKQDAEYLNTALDALAPFVLPLKVPFSDDVIFDACLFVALRQLGGPITPYLKSLLSNSQAAGAVAAQAESVDIDMMVDELDSSIAFHELDLDICREDIPLLIYPTPALIARATIIHWLVLLELTEDTSLVVSSSLVDFLTTLNGSDLLIWRPAFQNLFSIKPEISRSDACRLLQHFGDNCLMAQDLMRTEAAPSMCVSLVTALLPLSYFDDSDELEKRMSRLLEWFSKSLVKKAMGTPRTLTRVSALYHSIVMLPNLSSRGEKREIYRQGLIELLSSSDLRVKYYFSGILPSIFDQLPPDSHDEVFDQIFDGFPNYPDWIEGTAVRLFLLGQLASSCRSLLRRSMYRVFESAGQIPQSSPYARRCLETVSRSLQLNGPKDIFRVFASQLLYTWLEPRDEGARQSLGSIPFTIFGYFSLKDMLLEVQDEIMGQIMLRAHNEEMDEISSILERPLTDLLATSFAKCEAYVVASSISVPPSPLPQKTGGGEKQIKQLLGKDKFYELLIKSLPSIIATLIRRVDEAGIESLKKFSDFDAVNKWDLIDHKYHSDISVPIGQQPCFRSKYLYDELFYICRRVNMPINQMWNSSLFCYVARSLMDTVQPALGSLHACAVLRKLKLLLCISGDVVFEGYGSPMILHFLRPFLTDKWCCGDALGMFWYLYENRNKESIFGTSFEIGLSVSSLASLRSFMLSPGHSGEQGTLSKSASSALKQFLQWFPQHLSTFSEDICGADDHIISFFHKLIQLTKDSEGRGRSHSHTAAGRLLLLLLEDQASPQPILVDPAKVQLFNFLGHDFQRELQSHLDILGTDDKAIDYALNAWRCCPHNGSTIPYKLWVARALGRAYASSGKLDQSLLREQKDCYHTTCLEYPALSSKLAIVKVLCDTLMSSSPNHVGLAERTLQMVVQRLGSNSVASECQKAMPEVLVRSFHWGHYTCPGIFLTRAELGRLYHGIRWNSDIPVSEWARELAIYLCQMKSNDAVIGCLPKMVYHLPDLAEQFLPYIIHDVLLSGSDGKARHRLSAVFNQAFESESKGSIPHIRLIIICILYLRHQPYPQESNADDRDFWLDINYNLAASAAERCDMRKTALLFIEIYTSRLAKSSRRRLTGAEPIVKAELLDRIFKSIDDPDLPYGIEKKLSPEAILDVLSYDCSSTQKLSFLTASHDANIRLSESFNEMNQVELVETLNELNFQGLASDLLTAKNNASEKAALSTALYLQQWDIPVSSTNKTPTASVFKALKCLNTHNDENQILSAIDESFLSIAGRLKSTHSLAELKECMCCLANLAEIDEIISTDPEKIRQQWERIFARNHWLKFESFADIKQLLICREAMFSSLARSSSPNSVVSFDPRTSRELQFRTIQESLRISRDHNELQVATKSAVLLTKLVPLCKQQGLSVDIAAQFELAQVLWDQGETARSIQLLKDIQKENLASQTVEVNMSRVLSTLGHRIAEARLEDPRDIRDHYLQPASDWLTKDDTLRISDRGKVFHDFAVFCDRQVSNQDVVEDLRRLEGTQSHKEEELLKYNSMLAGANGQKRKEIQHATNKAKAWLELVHNELAMQKEAHESLKISAVLNYLKSLADSDDYKSDVLRFCALWMDNSDNDTLNAAVSDEIKLVPSRRFAPLVNQLFSRLDDVVNGFQPVLQNLLLRICTDHPYHGMYQAFMSSMSLTGADEASKHRNRAANMLASRLKVDRLTGAQWAKIYNANLVYLRFAQEAIGGKIRSGTKIPLAKSEAGSRLAINIPQRKLPPPTMKIEVREDCDYSQVPVVVEYLPECSIASGLSAPKIVTAVASDGKRYKQLFKTGNDDLRQDLVMEQVFEQVNGLLKEHRETRQRELGIRTYKVVPLTTNTGIIEFVQNTIPLNDYLLPAHASHFPRDMDFNQARQTILQVQNKSPQERLKAYKRVTNNFHPVLRFFFMEKFLNPDDWFSKRLAYTRSTAAISILGHILGLGDRHGHNILLDEQTGEVIHIDLGVAFEQGRILPVPEVVPFRLTRDLVDGMGITKTEGVFRRSCEFTLAALRRESYSIMTILDVLRYDPLYNWSLSPTRAKKMQDTQEAGDIHANGKKENEPSEANRSLAVVAKKLGETLSVSATVSELIQQATDERNLAVLFCGWAAFI